MDERILGRIMALDLGERRIGVALSDELRLAAKPFEVIKRKSRREDFERYKQFAEANQINLIVVGLPIRLDGTEGRQAAWVRDYVSEMDQHFDIPIVLWDEGLTTLDARASLRARGKKGRRLRQQLDAEAAAVILRSYLAAHRS